MAQETAATIGIPVIQNEVIPALENYARRQERAAALEAARQRRQMELDYKQSQVSVPSMPAPKGGYFQPYVKQLKNAFLQELTTDVASRKYSQSDINTKANVGIANLQDIDAENSRMSSLLDDEAKSLQAMGVTGATPGLISAYVDQGLNSKTAKPEEFFTSPQHLENFRNFALSDYRNISPAKIAELTLKNAKPNKVKIESGNKTEDFEYYDVFDVGTVKDPMSGTEIVAAKNVNIPKAEAYIEADNNRKALKDSWIASRSKVLQADPQYAFLTDDEKAKKANEAAKTEFYESAFRPYMTQKYGRTLDEPGRATSGGGRNAYAKFGAELDNLRFSSGQTVPVYGFSAPAGTALDIPLASKTVYWDTGTNQSMELTEKDGGKLISPSIGFLVYRKGTNQVIDPSQYSSTDIKDVDFKPGVYGTLALLQEKKTTGNMFASTPAGGPYVYSNNIFIEEGLPKWKTLASQILQAKGSSYNRAKAKALSELKRRFKQPGAAPAKKKFRTSK